MKLFHEILRDALLIAVLLFLIAASASVTHTMGAVDLLTIRADEDLQRIEREALNHSDNMLQIEAALRDQVSGLRQDVLKRADTALGEVTDSRKLIDTRSAEVLQLAKDRSAEILTLATQTEADANAQLTITNGAIATVTAPLGKTLTQVNEAAPLFLDCEHNADCVFNRYQGTMHAIEKTAQAVEKAAPKIAESATVVADSAAIEAKKLTTPACAPSPTMHGFKRGACLTYNHSIAPVISAARIVGALL